MQQKVGVRFKIGTKVYSFLADFPVQIGDSVIVETSLGQGYAVVHKIEDLKDGYKKWSSDMNFLTLIILVPIVGFLLPFFIGMKNPKVGAEQLNKNKIEILDTLKSNLSKDTLNLTKRFVK